MAKFSDIQEVLDRILGDASPGNHRAFWRGRTRDEFVALKVFGMQIIELGAPERSNLVRALRGEAPFGLDTTPVPPGAFFPRMPARQPPAASSDIELIEQWIAERCPDRLEPLSFGGAPASLPSDDTHVRYWREVDLFFLPGLSSPETTIHVGRLHMPAYLAWAGSNLRGEGPERWRNYMADPEVVKSFQYIRFHQDRLIQNYYGSSQSNLFDSLWKFGGDLLPRDPESGANLEHRMNGVTDWLVWIAYLEMSLLYDKRSNSDVQLARAWQVGIAADGLLRKDDERPRRMPIPEFNENDAGLKDAVWKTYETSAPPELMSGMLKRARDFLMPQIA